MTFNPLTSYEIIGIILTAITAVFAYLKSGEDAKTLNAVMASVVGAVLAIVLGLRFDVIPSMQAQLAQAEVIRKDPARAALLQRAAGLDHSKLSSNPLVAMTLAGRMQKLEDQFNEMANGRLIVSEEEMPLFTLQMITSANRTIEATNFIGLSKWWEKPWGDRYENENEEAAGRKVTVTRIFIFANQSDMPQARQIMIRELKHGVNVRYALLSDIPPFSGDVLVIDGTIAGEHRIVPGKGVNEAFFSLNRSDILREQLFFSNIETNSRDFQP